MQNQLIFFEIIFIINQIAFYFLQCINHNFFLNKNEIILNVHFYKIRNNKFSNFLLQMELLYLTENCLSFKRVSFIFIIAKNYYYYAKVPFIFTNYMLGNMYCVEHT